MAQALRWLLLCALAGCCSGKRISARLTLGGDDKDPDTQWQFLSKFGYDIGTGKYGFRAKLAKVDPAILTDLKLDLEVHLDEMWETAEKQPECARVHHSKRKFNLEIPANGTWSLESTGSVKQAIRPHVWYYALRDCQQSLLQPTELQIELWAVQEGGSEFSVELWGTLTAAGVKILLGTVFLGWFYQAASKFQASAGRIHPVIKVLCAAVVCQYASYVCYFVHLWVYQSNGNGVHVLDVLGEISSMLSQILVTSLSIFLAQGYTILPGEKVPTETLVPLFAVIVMVHVVIVGMHQVQDEALTVFHENEGVTGWVLVANRLMLFAWFVVSMHRSYAEASAKLLPFLRQFFLASSAHFLSYPILVGVASLFAPYLRHKVMVYGIFLMQSLVLAWYTSMFLTRGLYFEVSSLGGHILPTPQGSRKKPQLFHADRPNVWSKAE